MQLREETLGDIETLFAQYKIGQYSSDENFRGTSIWVVFYNLS
jgi:hypothetical protein